tara:strand:+ start:16038 stop:16283 length:246 start_codon:yes stop_codon:yes gene_type:complete
MKYKKFKIVFADPTGDSGWHTEDEIIKFIPEECIIEGYVFSKDKKYIKTFASYSTTANDVMTFGDVNVLPMSCVLSIKPIK